MNYVDSKLNELFEELVPASGTADTVAGEIVRAISRIAYRWLNDGDMIGYGYGKETCNPAARYLEAVCDETVGKTVLDAWRAGESGVESNYDEAIADLEYETLMFLEAHPELRTVECTSDMFSYRDPDEDVDYSYMDEEDSWCY